MRTAPDPPHHELVLLRAVARAALGYLAGRPGWTAQGLSATLTTWQTWRREQKRAA